MRRVRQFRDQHGRSRILKAQAQTDNRPRTRKHGQPVREALQEDAEDDDEGANDDGEFAADLLNEPPEEELADHSAETLRAIEDAELGARRVVEVLLPVCEGLHAVHHAAVQAVGCLDEEHDAHPCVKMA